MADLYSEHLNGWSLRPRLSSGRFLGFFNTAGDDLGRIDTLAELNRVFKLRALVLRDLRFGRLVGDGLNKESQEAVMLILFRQDAN